MVIFQLAVYLAMAAWRKLVLFGDSITQYSFQAHGWGSALADALQRKADVVNRGFSGYNTDHALNMLSDAFPVGSIKSTDALTIFFGANDSALQEISRQHVPVQRYETNLEKIIDYFVGIGLLQGQIILIAPPALDNEAFLKFIISEEKGTELDRKNDVTKLYAEACQRVAVKKSCLFVDTWSSFMEEKEYGRLLCDGLHLSDLGNNRVTGLLMPHVTKITSEWNVNHPDWKVLTGTP